MRQPPELLQAARSFERKAYSTTEALCRTLLARRPNDPDATHLLGLSLKQLGETGEACRLLDSSIRLAPANSEYRLNYANLLKTLGRLSEAEQQLRAALAAQPGTRGLRLALARLLNDLGRAAEAEAEATRLLEDNASDSEALVTAAVAQRALGKLVDAESSYRRALEASPHYAVARHNYGALLCELQRAEEALAQIAEAKRLGARGPALDYNRASALFLLGRFAESESALFAALKQDPRSVEAHRLLASQRFMLGDPDYTRELEAAVSAQRNTPLELELGQLYLRGGRLDEAVACLVRLAERHPASPEIASSHAVVLQESGDLTGAAVEAERAMRLAPDSVEIIDNLVAIRLQMGDADTLLPLILAQRRRHPLDQRWLAYQATAARLLDHADYGRLYNYDRYVRSYDLEPPSDYPDIKAFCEVLAGVLARRHHLQSHPLDQSLRHGTQTLRDLRINPEPVIAAFFEALEAPIAAYRSAIGSDLQHPFEARNHGAHRIVGSWSVRLGQGGYHVNHIHPRGWISSACYVELPRETSDGTRSGWLGFGEPRRKTPGAPPAHYVEPRVGRLVLFPSYMWHGTRPTSSDEPRTTIAFDLVPNSQ